MKRVWVENLRPILDGESFPTYCNRLALRGWHCEESSEVGGEDFNSPLSGWFPDIHVCLKPLVS
jgi:hypothetical protein